MKDLVTSQFYLLQLWRESPETGRFKQEGGFKFKILIIQTPDKLLLLRWSALSSQKYI